MRPRIGTRMPMTSAGFSNAVACVTNTCGADGVAACETLGVPYRTRAFDAASNIPATDVVSIPDPVSASRAKSSRATASCTIKQKHSLSTTTPTANLLHQLGVVDAQLEVRPNEDVPQTSADEGVVHREVGLVRIGRSPRPYNCREVSDAGDEGHARHPLRAVVSNVAQRSAWRRDGGASVEITLVQLVAHCWY